LKESYLNRILEKTAEEILEQKLSSSLADMKSVIKDLPPSLPFIDTLLQKMVRGESAIIAEMKKASPSKGVIRKNFQPRVIAKSYENGGADCLSILTNEPFFYGHLSHIGEVRSVVNLPILRKDFIIDEFQIYQSRQALADCILLIVAALSLTQLEDYYAIAGELDLDVLLEVHDEIELELALNLEPKLIGVNNRDLRTFEVNLSTSIELNKKLQPNTFLISESGINSAKDIALLKDNKIFGYLIGEAFMREDDPGSKIKEILM
jgi:indole-3-glycerol phosphate synthase